jgi:predicted GNAT family acetyltransferase
VTSSTSTALDVAIEALAHIRGFTHPKEIMRHGPLRIYRDAPGMKGPARTEELFSYGASANELLVAVKDYAPRGKYFLEPLLNPGDDGEAMKQALKAAGYRLARTEPFFACALNTPQQPDDAWQVKRVASFDEAKRVGLEALNQRGRPMLPEHFTSPRPLARMYYVEVDGKAVAAVTSVQPRQDATWVHNLGTRVEYRRRGIATALMRHMLADDAHYSAKHSVLLASHTGALLYPQLGYKQIGLLHIYNPPKN